MDYTQPYFWAAIGIGGTVIAALSSVQQLYTKDSSSKFRYQPVIRDFCFGAFLTAVLYMFLPESITSWISAGQNLVTSTIQSAEVPKASSSDYELQVGPAKF